VIGPAVDREYDADDAGNGQQRQASRSDAAETGSHVVPVTDADARSAANRPEESGR
jgi:hypothetical protein